MADRLTVLPQRSLSFSHPWIVAILLFIVFGIAARFIVHYAFPYFRFDPAYFQQYWPRRGRLILHISGGMLALVCGPFQLWTGLRQKALNFHRWTGRLYLAGVAVGSTGAFLMASHSQPSNFGVALMSLAFAWIITSGIALAAIVRGMVSLHREWMARSYLVTFGFVTFRFLDELPLVAHQWGTFPERAANVAWVSWVLPLAIFEVILQARRIYLRRPAH